MASGHEYRTRRPNTWLLRPTPQVKILLANPARAVQPPQCLQSLVNRTPAALAAPTAFNPKPPADVK